MIINYLAAKDYERLIMDDINLIPFEGIQICSEMLNKRDIKNNTEAQFCCYTKLAKYYFRDSEYQKAIDSLKEATLIKADNLVANMRLAELYERVGSGENAIIHYEAALKSKDVISDKLREFVNSQIQIVKTKGPRKKQPPAGYKWMTG